MLVKYGGFTEWSSNYLCRFFFILEAINCAHFCQFSLCLYYFYKVRWSIKALLESLLFRLFYIFFSKSIFYNGGVRNFLTALPADFPTLQKRFIHLIVKHWRKEYKNKSCYRSTNMLNMLSFWFTSILAHWKTKIGMYPIYLLILHFRP